MTGVGHDGEVRAVIVTGAFPPSPESVSTTTKHLIDEAVRQGHEPKVVTTGLGPTSYRGIPVARVRSGDAAGISRELTAYGPDLVHIADPRLTGSAALRAARRLGLPSVVSHHSLGSGPLSDWRGSIASSGADRSLVGCLFAQEGLRAAGDPAELWRPGTDLDLYADTMRSETLVDRWARGRSGKHLLVVGYVGPVDRPNVVRRLVDIAGLRGVRLVVVRAGAGAERLRARIPGAKVLGDVGGVDLAHAVASFDVLVQPRKKDLDCHDVRRALASGVPVIGFATGGIIDLVAHRVNGMLVDPARRRALCAGVERLRDDPELRGSLAARARESLAGRTWADAYAELLEVHWSSVLTTGQAHAG